MTKFFTNPEVKSITVKFIIIQVVFMAIGFVGINMKMEKLKSNLIRQNTAVIGKILSANPELADDIIGYFTKEATKEELIKGEDIAKQYYYDSDLPLKITPFLNNFYVDIYKGSTTFILINSILILLLIFIEYKNMITKISIVASSAEKAIEGKIEKLPESGEGEFCKLVHNFNDMTNRLQLNIEALDKEKVFLKDIISDISHQLKTPLSSLMILNDIMLKRKITKEQLIDFLEKSGEQLERMEWLIINLLKMAKMEVGSVRFDLHNGSVLDTINKSISFLNPILEEKFQCIVINENIHGIQLCHDEEWLSEAFANIIKNCVEHTEIGGEIHIEVTETPLSTSVIIKDKGEGISSKDLPHIFERFYKASTTKSNSIGIGLSLAKSIIEKQGGDIIVKSKLGEGTEFSIMFLKNVI